MSGYSLADVPPVVGQQIIAILAHHPQLGFGRAKKVWHHNTIHQERTDPSPQYCSLIAL